MIGDRWGVTVHEVARRYGCDELVPHAAFQAWRGVTIEATPEQVWPWVAQIRLAPYSYDWIDNLGRRSPQDLRALADPVPGQPFMSALAGRQFGRIETVDVGRQITGRILAATMSYELVPVDGGTRTRLLLKIVMARGGAIAPLVAVGDLVMARRQLLNLAALAESSG